MPDYARLEADFFERQGEVTCAELRIYTILFFHSYVLDNGIRVCKKSLKKICEIYDFLDYDNTSRRIKRLQTGKFSKGENEPKKIKKMKSPWLKKELIDDEWHFVLLVGVRKKIEADFADRKITRREKKAVKNAVKTLAATSETNGHKSQFTLEECIRYAEIEKAKGEPVRSVIGLAKSIWLSGDSDSFIQAALYPEPEPRETADEFDQKRLQGILAYALDAQAEGLPIEDYRKFVNEEDWLWVLQELEKAQSAKS